MSSLTGAGRRGGRGDSVGVRGCTLLKSAKREGRTATWCRKGSRFEAVRAGKGLLRGGPAGGVRESAGERAGECGRVREECARQRPAGRPVRLRSRVAAERHRRA